MKLHEKETLLDVVKTSQAEIQAQTSITHGQRLCLKNSAGMVGDAGMLGASILAVAQDASLAIPESNKTSPFQYPGQ